MARCDLQAWMHSKAEEQVSTSVELDEPEKVFETIASVKEQQSKVMDQLSSAQQQLETDIQIG